MRINRIKFGILSIAVISGFIFSACENEDAEKELAPSIADTPITVTEQLPEVKTLSTLSNYIGTVEADSTVFVIPKVNAEVMSKNFEVGDHVEAGDLLFTLDDGTAQIALNQANAALKSAQAGLSAAQANYEAGQAGYIAQEASNTAVHFAAIETLGKIDTTGQQLQVAADSADTQARQAGLSSDSAHMTYDYYKDQLKDAEEARDDLRNTADSANQALSNAQSALSAASSKLGSLNQIKEQYVNFVPTPEMTAEQFLISMGFSSVEELDAAIKGATAAVAEAQSAVNNAANAVATAGTALASMESTVDQLKLQKGTAGNTAESASLSYNLANESADLARRQSNDFNTYTRNTITSQALAQVIGSDQQLLANSAQIRASGAQVDAGSAGVEQASAAVENAKTALSYYKVTSPVSGTITAINISEHNMATSQQSAYTIKGDQPEKIVFYVAEKTAKDIAEGDTVSLEKDGTEFAGKIISVSNEVDAQKGLYRIEAQSLDPLVSLPYDSNIKLRAASRKSVDALTVPVDSVYYDGEQAFVYINEKGTARRRDVKIGLSEGGSVEIKEGLSRDEFVITSWGAKLKDGIRVIAEHGVSRKDDIVVVIGE
ncbi:MAG: efflux RND transporter periplasmic adaptor subunit [Lachnospiraceae bacterium]|nr:efflux RND transporter periplasmic adaptor subunit [Lachnospiraceae bacterium]